MAQLRGTLAELDSLLADTATERATELDRLQKLSPRQRMALAPLQKEPDERQRRLAMRIDALRRELNGNGGQQAR